MIEPTVISAAPRPASNGGSHDAVLVAAYAIFSAAMGAVLHFVLEAEAELSALAAVSCLSTLVAIHAMSRRAGTVASLDAEIADLKSELAGLRSSRAHAAGLAVRPPPGTPSQRSATPREPVVPNRQPAPVAQPSGDAGPIASLKAPPLPRVPPRESSVDPSAPTGPSVPEAGQPPTEPAMAPYWAVRPGVHREPQGGIVDPRPEQQEAAGPLPMLRAAPAPAAPIAHLAEPKPAAAEPGSGPLASVAAPIALDVAAPSSWPQAAPAPAGPPLDLGTMQNLIEQLAVQLNQPRVEDDGGAPEVEARSAHPNTAGAPAAFRPAGLAAAGPLPPRRTLAAVSRAPLGRLALIAEAVEADRMDVFLDPILGLSDRKARHFELSVRLLTTAGDELEADDYTVPAAGTGLLARIDQAKLARAAGVAQRLKMRGSQASLFSNIAGESLADAAFIGAFADILDAEAGLGPKLVLSFTQADARAFAAAHWEAITAMSEIGLKFALEDVRDLDMDFSLLRHHGFDFIKLEAEVFLEGLPTPSGRVPAADICRHLSELGLGLIVGGIVEEKDLARILGFGALLGQGTLFGAPRSVQLDVERRAA